MKDKFRKQNVSLLMICIFMFVFSGCFENRKIHITLEDFRIITIKEAYPLALKKALEWNSDAYLASIHLRFQLQIDTKPLKATLYFESRTDPNIWINIYIRESSSGYEIDVDSGEHNDSRPKGLEIVPDNLPFDEMKALRLAFEYGGRDFFERYDTPRWPLSLQLQERFPLGSGQLVWIAHYLDYEHRSSMVIYIDAETGEWVEIRDNQPEDGDQIKTPTK